MKITGKKSLGTIGDFDLKEEDIDYYKRNIRNQQYEDEDDGDEAELEEGE